MTMDERFIPIGPKSYGFLGENLVFIRVRIRSTTSASQEADLTNG